ncbi:MAG: DUF3822 family protein [Bacteroidota bacterium]|nr:DUF3822 family protein [Bacteroidota bacterium]
MINEAYSVKKYYKDNFDLVQKSNLSFFFSSNSFIFCEFSVDFKKILHLADIEFNLQNNPSLTLIERLQFIFSNYQLIKNYNKVYINILNTHFTLIPNAFKNENSNTELLQFGTGLMKPNHTIEKPINNLTFCYTVEHELKHFLEKTFPIAIINHSGVISLSLFNSLPSINNFDIFISINFGFVEISIKQNNDLHFYNVFNYQSNEDIIYYLLFTVEQLNLNPLTIKVAIAGQIETTDHLIISLKKYIKHINFIINEASIFSSNELKSIPNHFYFSVLNQHLCA